MSDIAQKREALKDIGREIASELEKGYKMATDDKTEFETIKAQSEKVDMLQVREALMKKDLEAMEGAAPKPEAKPNVQKSMFANQSEFLRAVREAASTGNVDRRLIRNEATGQNETEGADGGYLLPPEYATGILAFADEEAEIYPQARKVQISGNKLVEAYLQETDRKAGNRHGGIITYWKGEAEQYEASKAQFGERTTNVNKLTALVPMTEELLMDVPAAESTINGLVGKAMAWERDESLFTGAGNANMPLGVLAAGNLALITIAKEAGQTAADVLNTANVLKMFNAFTASKRKNAKFYINQDLELYLMQKVMLETGSVKSTGAEAVEAIVGTAGMPLYTPPGAYGNGDGMLLGRPVVPSEHCSALGAVGDILLCDFSQYLVIERTGINRQSSIHVRFEYDETLFKFSWRIGGRPDWMYAIGAAKGETKRSPYVTLAAR